MKNGKIKAYKGFNTDLTCRDFQYEVGKEYEQKGEIEACNKGFHACETPMDVFEHYLIEKDGHIARFCEVEQSGMIDREDDKVASSKISIKAEVKFADFVKLAVDFVLEKCKVGKGNSEDFAQLASSGNFAKFASSGSYAKLASSGSYAKLASSGNFAKFASSGSYAQLASSGNFAQLASSGSYAQLASSGDSAKLASSGNSAVVMAAGYNSQAKAKKGSWITLAEWDRLDGNWTPVCVKTEQVDGERIKEDTWYKLINGQFTEI
nr:MAG TPA: hypothetical protein [Caudoviricetes sp.]